jgi:hypothetical protein
MIAEPPPNPNFKALTGGYLYAKATALAAKGRIAEAEKRFVSSKNSPASCRWERPRGLTQLRMSSQSEF